MNITWNSYKGKSRKLNNDSVALAYIRHYLLAVVVDAAEQNKKGRLSYGENDQGKRLATYWADTCAKAIVSEPKSLVCEQTLITLLEQQQKTLRQHYLYDIASYGVLIFDTQSCYARWWYTGDCRLGYENSSGDIEWLNTPHRMDQFLRNVGDSNASSLDYKIQQAAKHTLTKSLNVRRFIRPDRVDASLLVLNGFAETERLFLATDGYWCEHLQDGVELSALNDDASFLTIMPGQKKLQLETDAPNLYITYGK